MRASDFLQVQTLLIMALGLVAFIVDTAGGVLCAKFINLFLKQKINPMIGACGISAFPMSGRVRCRKRARSRARSDSHAVALIEGVKLCIRQLSVKSRF